MMEEKLLQERTKKIEDYIANFKSVDVTFEKVFSVLEKSQKDYGIFGSFIRDSIESKPLVDFREINIIIDTDVERLLIENGIIDFDKNNSNIFKIRKENNNWLDINLWSKADHFAFKNQLCNKKWRNVSKTTIINYDSLFYLRTMTAKFWTEGYDLFYEKNHRIDWFGFRKCIENKPNIAKTVLQIGLILANDEKSFLHHKVLKWMRPMISNKNLKEKMFYEYEKYYKQPLTEELYQKMISRVRNQKQ